MNKHEKDPRLLLAFAVSCLLLWALAVLCVLDTAAVCPEAQRLRPPNGLEHFRLEASAGKGRPAPAVWMEAAVTYYDCCVLCCGKTDGVTASGAAAVPYVTCAVDPAVIPLGSVVYVDFGGGEVRQYLAQDTGGAVWGRHIDICVSSHEEALALGVRMAKIYWEGPA